MSGPARLDRQMAFLIEVDRLKSVIRANRLCDGARYENTAEHSWHLALYALTLSEHAPDEIDANRVIAMLLLHDIVEIDAGDMPVFGDVDEAAKAAEEARAATRIFGLLPPDQGAQFRALWEEFEAGESREARFAKSLDRFQPPNQNLAGNGGSWVEYDISYDQFETRVATKIDTGAPRLWAWLKPRVRAWFDANR